MLNIGRVTLLAVLATTAAGCATGSALRPQPFPGAAGAGPAEVIPGDALRTDHAALMGQVLTTAIALTGRPYVFGGAHPSTGFDCSGLVWYAFLQHQVVVPRTTAELYEAGDDVGRAKIEAGDLVFFSTTSAGPSHVGFALDPRTLVHAPSSGTAVRVERFDTPYWQSRLVGVRRIALGAPGDAQPADR